MRVFILGLGSILVFIFSLGGISVFIPIYKVYSLSNQVTPTRYTHPLSLGLSRNPCCRILSKLFML